MGKNVYFDPYMGNKGNMMMYRSDVVSSQAESNGAKARDLKAARELKAEQKAAKKKLRAERKSEKKI